MKYPSRSTNPGTVRSRTRACASRGKFHPSPNIPTARQADASMVIRPVHQRLERLSGDADPIRVRILVYLD